MSRSRPSRAVPLTCLLAAGCLAAPDGPSGGGAEEPGGAPDAGGEQSPLPGDRCAVLLEDTFEGAEVDRSRWSPWLAGSATVAVDPPGLRLQIEDVFDPLEAGSFAVIESTFARPIGTTRITARLDVPVSDGEAGIEWNGGEEDALSLNVANGQFWFEHLEGGSWSTPCVECLAYDPDLHRLWRLRSTGGLVYAEVSADGDQWTELGRTETPPGDTWRSVVYVVSHDSGEVTALVDAVRWADCPDA